MKSYQAHLLSTGLKNPAYNKKNQVLRSSAIFPFIINKALDTKILFMGYWLLKRNIKNVILKVQLRSQNGNIIKRKISKISEVKAFSISVKKILNFKSINQIQFGSIELEIFSKTNMVYPYPAVVVNYEGKDSSTFVHTCGRIYNNKKDFDQNNQQHVMETGVDILPNENFQPFFSFVNGKTRIKRDEILIKIINNYGEILNKRITIENLKPYETKFIFFLNSNEKQFLKGEKGTLKIKHNFKSFFPRFLSGNIEYNNNNSSLTHTYYDTSNQKNKSTFWLNPDTKVFYDSSVSFPLFKNKNSYTELVIYPNFPKCNISFDIEIFNSNGKEIKKIPSILKLNKKIDKPIYLKIKEILKKKRVSINFNKNFLVKLIVKGNGKVPTRLKFGLNLGFKNKYDIPSNICFNAHVPNKNVLTKPGTFKWAPLLNKYDSFFVISNTSNLKNNNNKDARIILNFWNEQNNKFLEKKIFIKNNASYWFRLNEQKDIKRFLKNKTGWVTIKSNNPFVNGWYIEKSKIGFIGADHFF